MVSARSTAYRGSGGSVPRSPPVPECESRNRRQFQAMSVRSLEIVNQAIGEAEAANRSERAYPQNVVDAAVAASAENDALFSDQQLKFSESFAH